MSLFSVLEQAATTQNGIDIYPPGNTETPDRISYRELLQKSQDRIRLLRRFRRTGRPTVILLHFDSNMANIEWLWATIASGCTPAMSTPFAENIEQRRRHLRHLQATFAVPIILTHKRLFPAFLGIPGLRLYATEDLEFSDHFEVPEVKDPSHASYGELYDCWIRGVKRTRHETIAKEDGSALFMLTSGSSGEAKAVALTHGQVVTALRGKSLYHETDNKSVFLNWIGMDHVANLTEIHLHAMSLGANQVHVHAADVLVDPLTFLRLLSRHRISYTFAPNFFLASLCNSLDLVLETGGKHPSSEALNDVNLSDLRALISGGEANVVETCAKLTEHLTKLGTREPVIRPGFGMTETCAGSVYGKDCPSYDTARELEFAALGHCIPGIELRVVLNDGSIANEGQVGELQIHGDLVFKKYLNEAEATSEAFTDDGWFKTGDRAFLDSTGSLNLAGRVKENIIINGVKCYPHQIEKAIEDARLDGIKPSFFACFPCRPAGSQTETFCIVYCPEYDPLHIAMRIHINDRISSLSALTCGARPYMVLPLDDSHFQKTSLGKLSRSKFRTTFEAGRYDDLRESNERLIKSFKMEQRQDRPTTQMEDIIISSLKEISTSDVDHLGASSNLFEAGVTSIDLLRLKATLEDKTDVQEVALITMLASNSIEDLARALEHATLPDAGQKPREYSPVVPLNAQREGTPLWLVHPGVGEVLVFLNLAKHMTDRPIYALRARGFEQDEEPFDNIPGIVRVYCHHIKETQPTGPYAIAGYSFGAMLAFEIAKQLEAQSDKVQFLGSFNLPPHIKTRMQQLDWIEVALNLGSFLGFYNENYVVNASAEMHHMTEHGVLGHIMRTAPSSRLQELSLTRKRLERWISLAFAMQNAACDYEPSGAVEGIDIFYCNPLTAVAKSKEEWLEEHLSKWSDFARSEPRMHEVDGAHYTMLDSEHVVAFQAALKSALADRGL